jgi:hypothetical protein
MGLGDKVKIGWSTAVEAKRAFRAILKDEDSYFYRVMLDDKNAIRSAIRDLEKAIERGKDD